MNFKVFNNQKLVPISEAFWTSAFDYASRELQIEHHRADVVCAFIPTDLERKVKFKHFALGATDLHQGGAWFYICTGAPVEGYMVKTFFHEMTHVKQLLMGELIVKPRSYVWKTEKWDKREYSFSPWEIEANEFSKKSYKCFLRREVTRRMQDKNVSAYHPSIRELRSVFAQEDVFRLTRELHREREKQALVASSSRDWLMMAS
jgi:hypothetical protein